MITFCTKTRVSGLKGTEVTDFFLNPTDAEYQAWWEGTHLQLHPVTGSGQDPGDRVFMDEFIGGRRVRMTCIVTEVVPGRRILWQLVRFVRLPAWLSLDLEDDAQGVTVIHTLRIGFTGLGRILDPFLRLYFSNHFATALDDHARTEFAKMGELLHG